MIEMRDSELWKRYEQSRQLLRRCVKALGRTGWQEGEKDGDVSDEVLNWLSQDELESQIFPDPIPWVKRPTGRTIPDLSSREHLCEYQNSVHAKSAASATAPAVMCERTLKAMADVFKLMAKRVTPTNFQHTYSYAAETCLSYIDHPLPTPEARDEQ